ncbi:DUF6731 family protein [Bacillus sp. FDAARGOS_235]|uniref:DUF6731 family protein n=1 Tax=Bacillus sp. FDAARGOS_235 TaxID=1839798 RepID=UPI0011A66355|nr:DUF6731 family protein [Bacillus sp. FDAARGOS_235]
MSRSIQYYNCFLTLNGEKTDTNISDFLDAIIVVDPPQRFKRTKYGPSAMIHMAPPVMDPRDPRFSNRRISVGKYRDRNKPYLGTMGTDRAIPIQDDVLELTSCVFIPEHYMVLIEYNHHGCRPTNIENYFNSFLPNNPQNQWAFELIPIQTTLGMRDIEQSNDIRNIEFKLDLVTGERRNIFRNGMEEQENTSLIGNIINTTVDSHLDFGANTASIAFGNGRQRLDVIQSQRLIELIRTLDFESEIFESVKVRYKSQTTNKVEDIDLKNEGVLKRIILDNEDQNGWEYVSEETELDFYRNHRPGHTNYRDYEADFIVDAVMPALDIPPLDI